MPLGGSADSNPCACGHSLWKLFMPLCAAIRLRSLSKSSTARTSAAVLLAVDPDQNIVSEDLTVLVPLLDEMLVPRSNLIPLIFTCQ